MRSLSGIQPSGRLHLGNYFGSIVPNLQAAKEADESFFFVADLHALTTVQNAEELKKMREDIILDYLACGFDPAKTILYYQSDIPEHTELMWALLTVTPMGLLERAVSYKDKTEKGIKASAGLFTYPVLMAADILLYDADIVPVGKDQKQHVEMARDIAQKFHGAFGETFVIPEPRIHKDTAVVPGVDGQKMSKSYGNTIPLFGSEAEIKKAIMGIVTDSKGKEESKDPATNTIFAIHSLFLNENEKKDLVTKYTEGGLGYGDAKKMLLETYMDVMSPLHKKREALAKNSAQAKEVVTEGAKKASAIAQKTMERVRSAIGLS